MKFLKTRWERFIVIICVFAFIFSLVAVILTVYAIDRWGVFETVGSTRLIFSTYGLLWGGVIIIFGNFIGAIIVPVVLLFLISRLEDGILVDLAVIFFWCFVEAFSVYVFSSGFLDIYTDVFVLNELLKGTPKNALFSAPTILSIAFSLSLLVFVLSFSFRILKYTKPSFSKRQEN